MSVTSDVVFGVEGTILGYGLTEGSGVPENIPKFTEIKSVDQETCFLDDSAYVTLASSRTFCAGEKMKKPCIGEKRTTLNTRRGGSSIGMHENREGRPTLYHTSNGRRKI